ncbi:MAG: cobyric acid synthase [Dehalococcoidia bacterium]|nr:cobyric acid synthase [Dehalococcoidia bacterium]
MRGRTLMIQGTGSSVGKSIMVAALCRIMHQDGFRVAPYKSQNMALNSFVTRDGGEMGRAQVVQAEAAGIEPTVDMNPVLLKPEADARAQVVVMGKPFTTTSAYDYYKLTPELFPIVEKSLNRLRDEYDIVIIEGAGSPAEINLRRFEIVNMSIAKLAQAPVLLVGDIDKGGVFAQLMGTVVLLEEEEASLLKGFIINKFRGDVSILKPGLDYLEERTSIPVLGVVPYYHDIMINEEDSIYREPISEWDRKTGIDIAVVHLPRISNSTDFEPLQQEAGVRVRYITMPWQMDNPDLIIIPGSKSTISDLSHIKGTGLASAIVEKARSGTPVIGICGGFQMLGWRIDDPERIESEHSQVEGLGLLDIVTDFESAKTTHQIKAKIVAGKGLFRGLEGETLTGYEIHMGQSRRGSTAPAFEIIQRSDSEKSHPDGAVGNEGMIFGTYLHGLFDNERFRRALLRNIKPSYEISGAPPDLPSGDEQYNKLADLVRQSLDIERIYQICGLKG